MTVPPASPALTPEQLTLMMQFRKFLVETNAVALAIAVVLGGAASKLVTAIVDGIIMPLISLVLPGGDWRTWKLVLQAGTPGPEGTMVGEKAIQIGLVLAATLDFVIVAAVVFFIAVRMLKIEIKK